MKEISTEKKVVSLSILQKRWRKFKTLKRGYYSFLIILFLYLISFILPIVVGRSALLVKYNDSFYFPLFKTYQSTDLGQKKDAYGEANYRILKQEYAETNSDNWVLMPLYPFGPNENLLNELEGNPPHPPSFAHWCGTDDRGRDVFARLVYGFNIGISFALVVTVFSFAIGIFVGAILGYFGGKTDIFGLRLIEIWGTLPVLYVII
ncbi:MAG: ABC transporter permease, partial [bacterium]